MHCLIIGIADIPSPGFSKIKNKNKKEIRNLIK
jgi:hypothetical protein